MDMAAHTHACTQLFYGSLDFVCVACGVGAYPPDRVCNGGS